MEKTIVSIYKKNTIKAQGGALIGEFEHNKDLYGYLIPLNQEINRNNNKALHVLKYKFISDEAIETKNIYFFIDGKYFEIQNQRNVYQRGAILELVFNE